MAYEMPTVPASVSKDKEYLTTAFSSYANACVGTWPIERIRQHRDAHQEGRIWAGKRLARAMLRSPEVKAALMQRVAPALGILHVLDGGREDIRAEIERGLWSPSMVRRLLPAQRAAAMAQGLGRGRLYTPAVRKHVHYDLAMCGVAILQCVWHPRKDGARWDLELRPWSLEAVDYDAYAGAYYAHTREGGRVPIRHGDGKWIVIEPLACEGFDDGAVIPLALVFAASGYNAIDRAGAGRAIGSPKLKGKLPPGISTEQKEGLALEAAMETAIQGKAVLTHIDQTEVAPLEFSGNGWQIFGDADKSHTSKIFLALTGQDGGASNSGGSYTKALILEGVLFALVEADTVAEGAALTTGALAPYAEINAGDPDLAPTLSYPLPDPEEDARLKSIAERHTKLTEIVKARREGGFAVTQEDVDELAAELRVRAPRLADIGAEKQLFAYDINGGSFTRNEHRRNRGFAALPGPKGEELIAPPGTAPAEEAPPS